MDIEGRNSAFQGGANGTGLLTATSMQQDVPRAFSPAAAGIGALPNMFRTINGESPSTYEKRMPGMAAMRTAAGFGGNSVMGV